MGLTRDMWPNGPVGCSRIYPSCGAKSKGMQGVRRNSYPGSGSCERRSRSLAWRPGTTFGYSPKGLQSRGWQDRSSDALPASPRPRGSPALRSRLWGVLDLPVPALLHRLREAGSHRGRDLQEPEAATILAPRPRRRGKRGRGCGTAGAPPWPGEAGAGAHPSAALLTSQRRRLFPEQT